MASTSNTLNYSNILGQGNESDDESAAPVKRQRVGEYEVGESPQYILVGDSFKTMALNKRIVDMPNINIETIEFMDALKQLPQNKLNEQDADLLKTFKIILSNLYCEKLMDTYPITTDFILYFLTFMDIDYEKNRHNNHNSIFNTYRKLFIPGHREISRTIKKHYKSIMSTDEPSTFDESMKKMCPNITAEVLDILKDYMNMENLLSITPTFELVSIHGLSGIKVPQSKQESNKEMSKKPTHIRNIIFNKPFLIECNPKMIKGGNVITDINANQGEMLLKLINENLNNNNDLEIKRICLCNLKNSTQLNLGTMNMEVSAVENDEFVRYVLVDTLQMELFTEDDEVSLKAYPKRFGKSHAYMLIKYEDQ